MVPRYHIHLIGPLEIETPQTSLRSFRSRKATALLSYLVRQTGPVSRSYLAHLFWPDQPEARGRRNLSRELSDLTQALPDCFVTDYHSIQFQPTEDYWVDTTVFEKIVQRVKQKMPDIANVSQSWPLDKATWETLRQSVTTDKVEAFVEAVALYRGDFMQQFYLDDCPDFDAWLSSERELWRQRITNTLNQLINTYALQDWDNQALHYARYWLSLEPWNETAHRHLMFLLIRSGQRDAALKQYELCQQALQEALDVEPSPQTQQLYNQILAYASPKPRPGLKKVSLRDLPCPYRGLASFTQEDAAFFFGRERFVDRLVTAIQQQSLVAVIGPSGSGKSSVVFAGMLPQLKKKADHPSYNGKNGHGDNHKAPSRRSHPPDFVILSLRPGPRPFHALAAELSRCLNPELDETTYRLETDRLAEALRQGEISLAALNSQILGQQPETKRVLLVIDQFEELYTLCSEPETRTRFLEVILSVSEAGLPESPPPTTAPFSVILTMRADFMGEALAYRPFADALQTSSLILGPMTDQEVSRAIEQPAVRVGASFEAGLVERLRHDVGAEPGHLPLLEFALTALWEQAVEQNDPHLTHQAYEAIGRVEGALAYYAERVYGNLSPPQQTQTRHIFSQLVQPGDRTEDTRRVATHTELGEERWALAQHLADSRLVVTGRDVMGQETIEVIHEALLDSWERLRLWLEEDRAFRGWQERLRGMLRQWQNSEQDESSLLRGTLLVEAEAWLAEREVELSPAEGEFIRAGLTWRAEKAKQAEQQRQKELAQAQALATAERQRAEIGARSSQRLRWLVAGLAVVLTLAIGAALWASNQQRLAQQAADISQSLNLATNAQLALNENNTDLALALALEANRLDEPPLQAQVTLADAAYAMGTSRLLLGHEGPVQGVAVSPDGQTALSASTDKTLILWDLASGEQIRRFTGHEGAVHDVAISPDGQTALSASADQTLILWDISTGEVLEYFKGHTDIVWAVAISPDGQTALSASADQTLILWDIPTGEILSRLTGHEAEVRSVAISPDGQMAISGDASGGVIHWDLPKGQVIHHIAAVSDTLEGSYNPNLGHFASVLDVAFLPDSQQALSASYDEHSILWDMESGEVIRNFTRPNISLYSLAISPDGNSALLGLLDSQIALIDLFPDPDSQGQILQLLTGHTGRVLALDITPDGRMAVSGAADGTLRVWHLQNGAEIRQVTYDIYADPAAANVAISPDGRHVLTGLWTGEISLWDYGTGQEIRRLRGHTEMTFGGVEFLPDGRRAVSGAGDIFAQANDTTVRLWDIETGQELRRFEGHTGNLWDVAVSPDGHWVASSAQDGMLWLWNVETGQGRMLLDVSPQAVRSIAFSPDGQTIAAGLARWQSTEPNYSIRLLDVTSGEETGRLVGHQEVVGDLTFSPDGHQLLSGSHDLLIILWDVATRSIIHQMAGHTGGIVTVAISPDGRLAVSGGQDQLILMWDLEQGAALRRFRDPRRQPVVDLTFTPNGQTFLSAADDDAIHEWRIDTSTDELLTWIAENRYVPELTCQQRAQYNIGLGCATLAK